MEFFKISKRFVVVSVLSSGLIACSSEPELELTVQNNPHWGTLMLDIQSLEDDLVLEDIVINRGNCKLSTITQKEIDKTVKMKYGQTYRAYSSNCNMSSVKEVAITSDGHQSNYEF